MEPPPFGKGFGDDGTRKRPPAVDYFNEPVDIVALARERRHGLIGKVVFEECEIRGPAILMFGGGVKVLGTPFSAEDLDAMIFELPVSKDSFDGVILVHDSRFVRCSFRHIGIACSADEVHDLRAHLEQSGEAEPEV